MEGGGPLSSCCFLPWWPPRASKKERHSGRRPCRLSVPAQHPLRLGGSKGGVPAPPACRRATDAGAAAAGASGRRATAGDALVASDVREGGATAAPPSPPPMGWAGGRVHPTTPPPAGTAGVDDPPLATANPALVAFLSSHALETTTDDRPGRPRSDASVVRAAGATRPTPGSACGARVEREGGAGDRPAADADGCGCAACPPPVASRAAQGRWRGVCVGAARDGHGRAAAARRRGGAASRPPHTPRAPCGGGALGGQGLDGRRRGFPERDAPVTRRHVAQGRSGRDDGDLLQKRRVLQMDDPPAPPHSHAVPGSPPGPRPLLSLSPVARHPALPPPPTAATVPIASPKHKTKNTRAALAALEA